MKLDVKHTTQSQVFFSFIISQPGALWNMKIDQIQFNEGDVDHEMQEVESAPLDTFTSLKEVCGKQPSRSGRHPRSPIFDPLDIRRFIKLEVVKRKQKMSLQKKQHGKSKSMKSGRKSRLLFGK